MQSWDSGRDRFVVGQAWVQDHQLWEHVTSLAEVWSVVHVRVTGSLPSLETGLSAGIPVYVCKAVSSWEAFLLTAILPV